jgi:calcium channel MID1
MDKETVGEGIQPRQGEPIAFELINNAARTDNLELSRTNYYIFTNASVYGEPAPVNLTAELPTPGLLRLRNIGEEYELEMKHIEQENLRLAQVSSSSSSTSSSSASKSTTGATKDGDGLSAVPKLNNSRTVYITLNTCLQPAPLSGVNDPPPQLTLYASTNDTRPGPNTPGAQVTKVTSSHGFALLTLNVTSSVYVAVQAPNVTTHDGIYSIQIAASIDAPYHSYNDRAADLFFIDGDSSSALLATKNLTLSNPGTNIYEAWMSLPPPYVIFAAPSTDRQLDGVSHSYCGLEKAAAIAGTHGGVRTDTVRTSMTNKTLGSYPKQQFYFQGLNASESYSGYLAMMGNSTAMGDGVVGGGGRVWERMSFTTQSQSNCAVVFNLTFCDAVNYAVPANSVTFPNNLDLAHWYDSQAEAAYKNFERALQQIPCEISSKGQYSLAKTCQDCANAYKSWLCSVTIPRCRDLSSNETWLQPRNLGQAYPDSSLPGQALLSPYVDDLSTFAYNSSRSTAIDEVVQPGPYKEVLPCQDICWAVVQSCPARLGFTCPKTTGKGEWGKLGRRDYGERPQDGDKSQEGMVTCNYPGAAYFLSKGVRGETAVGSWGMLLLATLVAWMTSL